MRPSNLARSRHCGNRQRGQTTTLVVLALGLFLLGAIGLAADVSNWWFHHQTAQGAADAACTAGVMDMLNNAVGGGAFGGFPGGSPPAAFACSGATGAAPCQYAALNGYNGAGLGAGPSNDVQVSFPDAVPGLPPSVIPPSVANPFIQVTVIDRVPTNFTGLLSGSNTRDVAGSAVCGVLQATAPVPIIVLNPTCQHALEMSGSTVVKIVGGPSRSVQVNSSNLTCAAAGSSSAGQCGSGSIGTCSGGGGGGGGGGACIDLSKGGKNFTGSEFAVVGQPKTPSLTFNPGATGDWGTGARISDPYALVSAPDPPAASPTDLGLGINPNKLNTYTGYVDYLVDGCPDQAGCIEYQPGLYEKSIVVKGYTAIFAPGLYYLRPKSPDIDTENGPSPGAGCLASNGPFNNTRDALAVNSNGVIRPSTATGDGSKGVMFYLTGSGSGSYASVFFGANAGTYGGRHIDQYSTADALCPNADPVPAEVGLPDHVDGNVLLGQCTSKGFYIGASGETSGKVRGLIFFQDRANADVRGQPSMQGGGGLIISGNMYFHNCNSSGTGTGCSDPLTGYNAFFQLQGTSGGNAYVLGNITTDELVVGGNGNIAMNLNPNAIYNILKASLLR
jgi:Putative Flp pilus-assembly TadE/G-like